MKLLTFNTICVLAALSAVAGCADATSDAFSKSAEFRDKTVGICRGMSSDQVKSIMGQPDSFITMDKYVLSRLGAAQAMVYDHPAKRMKAGDEKCLGQKDDQFLVGLDDRDCVTNTLIRRPSPGILDRPKLFAVDEYWRFAGKQGQTEN